MTTPYRGAREEDFSREMLYRERAQVSGPLPGPPSKGFVRLGEAMHALATARASDRQADDLLALKRGWEPAVGRDLAANTQVKSLRNGELLVAVRNPAIKMALASEGLDRLLLERAREATKARITRIRLVVEAF
ncbi:MAG: DUF721 domain-containing protein [Kiritimatiellae bacterium]|nr:DUF721 domain-containing protein [Kiritimatiellia bacterium]